VCFSLIDLNGLSAEFRLIHHGTVDRFLFYSLRRAREEAADICEGDEVARMERERGSEG